MPQGKRHVYNILSRADFTLFCTNCRPSEEKGISGDRPIEEKSTYIFKELEDYMKEMEMRLEYLCSEIEYEK